MSSSGHSPCLESWVFDPLCCDCIPSEEDRTPEQEALFQKLRGVAAGVLWRASGRRYGVCAIKARPCRQRCQESTYNASGVMALPWTPALINGRWVNCRAGSCACPCGECCSAGCREVILPGPVHAVTEVAIDGVVLPTDSYRVDDHRRLVRLYGWETATADAQLAHSYEELPTEDDGTWCFVPDVTNAGQSGLGPAVGGCRPTGVSPDTQPFMVGQTASFTASYSDVDNEPAHTVPTNGATLFRPADADIGNVLTPADPPYEVINGDQRILYRVTAGSVTLSGAPGSGRFSMASGAAVEVTYFVKAPTCWPECQNMALADGEVGTWSVTYELGIPIDIGGQYAFSTYLCELWKSCTGQRCRLPLNAEGVFRQGVNVDFSDANIDLLSGMRTGIPEVDQWLAGVNPDRLRQPSGVWSPDAVRPRTQTWP